VVQTAHTRSICAFRQGYQSSASLHKFAYEHGWLHTLRTSLNPRTTATLP
jgi:hypothetical protein